MTSKLQDTYHRLIGIAEGNPQIVIEDILQDDSCHKVKPGEPILCISPEDILDLLNSENPNIYLENGNGPSPLDPVEILELYRQLILQDAADGKLDTFLQSENLPLPHLDRNQSTALRFYGKPWTPDVRLTTYLKGYQEKLDGLLAKPSDNLQNSRNFVAGRIAGYLEESYPLMGEEQHFITETATHLTRKEHHFAANLVFKMIGRARAIPYRENYPFEDLARTMYFSQKDKWGDVSVFYTSLFNAEGKRLPFFKREGKKSNRRLTARKMGFKRLDNYMAGKIIHPGEYLHVTDVLRDTYVYRYFHYKKTGKTITGEEYFRTVVVHEALHDAALQQANDTWGNVPIFSWNQLALVITQQTPPSHNRMEECVQHLANLLQLQRSALDVRLDFERTREAGLQTPESAEKYRLAMKLEHLASEAIEYLSDEVAWKLVLENKDKPENSILPRKTPDTRSRIFNPNEENVLTKILSGIK